MVRCSCVAFSWVMVCLISSLTQAAELNFNVDPAQSRLDLSGVFVVDIVSQDEEDASLTTTFGGTITVDVDDELSPTSIQFLSASLEAMDNGDWLPEVGGGSLGEEDIAGDSDPGEPEPANFGMFVDTEIAGVAWGAFRGLVYTITSEFDEPTSVNAEGRFDSTVNFEVIEGTLDSNVQSVAFGDDAATQSAVGQRSLNDSRNGFYSVADGIATIRLPVDLYFPGDLEVFFEGTVVATLGSVELGCDIDGNGVCDAADIDMMSQQVMDGKATSEDRVALIESAQPDGFHTYVGDSDLNGAFDEQDIVGVFIEGKYLTGEAAGWAAGDWNGDLVFDEQDFVQAFVAGGYLASPRTAVAAVPEPSGLVLLIIGLVVTQSRRRSCRDRA